MFGTKNRPSAMARTACPRRRHGVAAVLTLFASAGHANEIITSIRCSNSHKAKGGTPPITTPTHTEDLAACQFQCDLFSSFQACDWFIFFTDGSVHENCLLYNPEREAMEEWLDDHAIRGQPVLGCPAAAAPPTDDEEKCVTPEKNQVDAGSLDHPSAYAPMNFAVSSCSASSVSDIFVTDKGTYEECLEHCKTSWDDEAEASRTEAP